MKITKKVKYDYNLTEDTLEKDMGQFILAAKNKDFAMDRHYGGEGLKIIKQYFKILKEKFGAKIGFWGGIDTQYVLPRGTVEDVEEEVKKRIRDLAPGGGFVLAAVHNIQRDVPPENIVTMFRAARKYGRYPMTGCKF